MVMAYGLDGRGSIRDSVQIASYRVGIQEYFPWD
jgi:hypothetical protein